MIATPLTSRDKNDIFWIKKRRYMVSSDYKNEAGNGNFNPDMVAEIKSAYQIYKEGLAIYELTGNEFMDTPPTASGQIAFAKSVAMMMHTYESIGGGVKELQFFDDIIGEIRAVIRKTLDAYFTGCGTDLAGHEYNDPEKKQAAREMFYQHRKEYENLIKVGRRKAEVEVIESIRKESGIAELMETEETGEDPAIEKLIEEHKEAYEELGEKAEVLRDISRAAITEASQRKAARDALTEPVKNKLEENKENAVEHRILRDAYDSYLLDVEKNVRLLLYRSEAAYYLLRWLLTTEPVDKIIASKISMISDEKPDILDDNAFLKDIPGYIKPEEDEYTDLSESDADAIYRLGAELEQYVSDHPYQFESQCLLSVSQDLDKLSDILPKAWAMVQAIDRITITGEYDALTDADKQRMFDIWVLSNAVCIVGYTITEVIMENPDKTIKTATETLEKMLSVLSFSSTEKDVRNMLSMVVEERSGFHVYQ